MKFLRYLRGEKDLRFIYRFFFEIKKIFKIGNNMKFLLSGEDRDIFYKSTSSIPNQAGRAALNTHSFRAIKSPTPIQNNVGQIKW